MVCGRPPPIEHADGLFEKLLDVKSMNERTERVLRIMAYVGLAVILGVPLIISILSFANPAAMNSPPPRPSPTSPSVLAPTPSAPTEKVNAMGITMSSLTAFYFIVFVPLAYFMSTRYGIYAIGLSERTRTVALYTGLRCLKHRRIIRVNEIIAGDAIVNKEHSIKITHELKRKSFRFGANAEIMLLAVAEERAVLQELGRFLRQCGESVSDTDTGFRCPERCGSAVAPARGSLPPLADPLITRYPIRMNQAMRLIPIMRVYIVVMTIVAIVAPTIVVMYTIAAHDDSAPDAPSAATPPSDAPVPVHVSRETRILSLLPVFITAPLMAALGFYFLWVKLPYYAYGLDRRTWNLTVYTGLMRFNRCSTVLHAGDMKGVEKRALAMDLGHSAAITHTKTGSYIQNPHQLMPIENLDEFVEDLEAFILEYKSGSAATAIHQL